MLTTFDLKKQILIGWLTNWARKRKTVRSTLFLPRYFVFAYDSSPQRHINESVASTSLLFWCHRFPNTPPPPRSGQLKRDFNWSIRCVRKILQQEMWRTNIGWTFGELWQISESYYLSKVKCVKTISIHNLQNYGWFSIKFKGAILWKSLRAGSRKDKEKIWTDAVIDAVVVTLSNFRK